MSILKQEPVLTRQVRKTIEAIIAGEGVSPKPVYRMLEVLGFSFHRSGSHVTWKHPKGHRITIGRVHSKELLAYELTNVRNVLRELGFYDEEEVKEVLNEGKIRVKPSWEDTKNYHDERTLIEKELPKVNQLNMTKAQPTMQKLEGNQQAHEVLELMKRHGSMLQSIEEFLIKLGVQVEDVKSGLHKLHDAVLEIPAVAEPIKEQKPKMTPEELKAFRAETLRRVQQEAAKERTSAKLQQIKKAMQEHPQFKDNDVVLVGISGIGAVTVKKYREQGLL
jgi:predicted RNA binding protein YcfA (HicA-like mRNA interferase family)